MNSKLHAFWSPCDSHIHLGSSKESTECSALDLTISSLPFQAETNALKTPFSNSEDYISYSFGYVLFFSHECLSNSSWSGTLVCVEPWPLPGNSARQIVLPNAALSCHLSGNCCCTWRSQTLCKITWTKYHLQNKISYYIMLEDIKNVFFSWTQKACIYSLMLEELISSAPLPAFMNHNFTFMYWFYGLQTRK